MSLDLLPPTKEKLCHGGYSHTAISTVGYGEMTPRSFLGRLVTLPLLIFGLLLIALPSFVLGREFSQVWNEMTSGQITHTPYMQSGNRHGQSELVRSLTPRPLTLSLETCSDLIYSSYRPFSRACGPVRILTKGSRTWQRRLEPASTRRCRVGWSNLKAGSRHSSQKYAQRWTRKAFC